MFRATVNAGAGPFIDDLSKLIATHPEKKADEIRRVGNLDAERLDESGEARERKENRTKAEIAIATSDSAPRTLWRRTSCQSGR